MSTRERVPARDLRAGDYLPSTKRTVVGRPVRGLHTPAGKVEVTLRRDGQTTVTVATWGASTTIGVTR